MRLERNNEPWPGTLSLHRSILLRVLRFHRVRHLHAQHPARDGPLRRLLLLHVHGRPHRGGMGDVGAEALRRSFFYIPNPAKRVREPYDLECSFRAHAPGKTCVSERVAQYMTTRVQMRRHQKCWYVYILSSLRGALYVGTTDDLRKRISEHKHGLFDGFTKKYEINRLMYYECFNDPWKASLREKQVKKFRREKKIALFTPANPEWKDLSPEIYRPV